MSCGKILALLKYKLFKINAIPFRYTPKIHEFLVKISEVTLEFSPWQPHKKICVAIFSFLK